MDYGDIIKRAWRVTWRYKALWILGLFAGASSGGGNGGGGNSWRTGGGSGTGAGTGSATAQAEFYKFWLSAQRFVESNLVAILVGAALLVLLGILLWIIGVAARGGLVHLTNEAEEGRPVRLRDGWSAGFHKWGRLFGVEFLTALPLLLLVAAFIGFGVAVAVSAASHGVSQGSFDASAGRLFGSVLCFGGIFSIIALILGVLLGIVGQIGIRYVMLGDYRVGSAIAQGWHDLWSRRGAFLMWLVTIGTGIAFGIAVAIIFAIFAIPGVVLILQRAWVTGIIVMVIGMFVLLLPSAIYGTFYSSMWTVFFRKMTGMEPAPVMAAPVHPGPYPGVPGAPQPPYQPQPPYPPQQQPYPPQAPYAPQPPYPAPPAPPAYPPQQPPVGYTPAPPAPAAYPQQEPPAYPPAQPAVHPPTEPPAPDA